jgi:hypothetical protein
MTPLEFPFRAFEEKDGPPPLRPNSRRPASRQKRPEGGYPPRIPHPANSPIKVASRFSPGSGVKWSTLRCNNRMYSRRGSLIHVSHLRAYAYHVNSLAVHKKKFEKSICHRKPCSRSILPASSPGSIRDSLSRRTHPDHSNHKRTIAGLASEKTSTRNDQSFRGLA